MSDKFFTNNEDNTLINKFEGVLTSNDSIKCFDALVGYFRASGYFKIRPFLDKVPNIRILVGINVDVLIANAHKSGLEFFAKHEKTKEEFIKDIRTDIENAKYDKDTENGILQFIRDLVDQKIQVKAHPEKKIHAKVYILRPEIFNKNTFATTITGSSNLTDAGLGGGKFSNYEFNVQLSDYPDVKFATDEFERLWNESVEILPIDIKNVEKDTYLNQDVTPFELFIKLLIEYFGKNIDYDPDSIGDLPKNFKKLTYQVDAVNEGFNMLMNHNGFMLADVVGLGKTVIAALIAKKYILQNGKSNTKILVVYPPTVEKNWKNTFKEFEIDINSKFISNGSLNKILEGHQDYWNKEEYDLIIVDEAHKFRTHTTDAFNQLQLITKSLRRNKGNIKFEKFKETKKIILVSATPLNNKPDDILHQISLFQDLRQSTLPITNLTSFFSPLSEKYKVLKRFEVLDVEKLREIYNEIRKNIIAPITIRRTRTDLEKIDEYKKDIIEQNIKFPIVLKPEKVIYIMDQKLNELFHKTVFFLTDEDKIKYSRYQAIAGLKKEIQIKYYENAETTAKSLAFIMKTQLVKRLESSFYAFKISLSNLEIATERMIKMFENDKIYIAPDTNINKLLDKGWSEEDIEKEIERLSEENPKNQIFNKSDFKSEFIDNLKKDFLNIKTLSKGWSGIEKDPKLDVFMEQLKNNFFENGNLEGKLVIFSESKETINFLDKVLKENNRHDVLNINSENRKRMHDTIVANFDANYPIEKQKNDYNIILSTEVLAEGVNLHRSNVVIHYDTPWNSTRLMQRIGRVNRIGTKADNIYNYVFYPSAQGDSQIQLNKTAFMKIQAFHTAFGEDNQVFSTDEILDEAKLYNGVYKEQEDERLKYLYLLRNFKKENKEWFNKIKKLPLKSRVGRNSIEIQKQEFSLCTAAFLKTEKKFEFYWINNENKPKEITPLDAFKIFEADQNEKSIELIDEHHGHVNKAIEYFENSESKYSFSSSEPTAQGGIAQKAKKFLSELAKYLQVTEMQKNSIQKIIVLIDSGKFTNLPTEIARLQKQKLNLNQAIEELNKIIIKYNIENSDTKKSKKIEIEIPVLIISESFK